MRGVIFWRQNSNLKQDSLATANPQTTTACYGSGTAPTCNPDTYHTYPAWQKPALDLPTHWTYDLDSGQVLSETDANGAVTTATYDKFGRLTGLRKPGDPSPNRATLVVSYFDANYLLYQKPYVVDIQQKINESTVNEQRKLYNGLGQLIQEQTAGAQLASGSRDIVVDYAYDANGAPVQKTAPYELATWNGVTPVTPYRGQQLYPTQPATRSVYDVLGRLSIVTAPDGTQQSYAYTQTVQNNLSYRVTEVTDARGNMDTSWTDLWGRTAQVIPPTGPGVSYTYDEADRLTKAAYGSASTTLSYDLAGRKISMSDADMGNWSTNTTPWAT